MRYSPRTPSIVMLVTLLALGLVAPAASAREGPPEHANAPDHARGERPTPPEHAERGLLQSTLARMSLEEKVGQLFWTRAYGAHAHDTDYAAQNQATYGVDTAAEVVEKYNLGGVLYFAWAGNTGHPEQMAELSDGLQATAIEDTGVPLSLSIDQETGLVQRLLEPATVFPGAMPLGGTRDHDLAADQWRVVGEELRAAGANTNFAPVTDVNTNPANPVIGVRSFGEDPGLVGDLGAIATRELQDAGVSATLKHFPGHGDTAEDSHFDLPAVEYDFETLEEVHLAPFAQAMEEDVDAIMTAHIVVHAVDPDRPATLSEAVLTGLLREDMGYDGVIVTDSLGMAGVRAEWGDDEIPVLALQAGADVLLNPPDMDVAYEAVLDAVESGELSEQRIDESVMRILEMKYERGLFDDPYSFGEDVMDHVGTDENLAVAEEVGAQAATLVRNDADVLPLNHDEVDSALVTGWGVATTQTIADSIAARGVDVQREVTGVNPDAASRAAAVSAAEDHDVVIATTMSTAFAPASGQQALVEELDDTETPVVVMAVRNPYDLAAFPGIDTYLTTYGWRPVSLQGAVDVAFGDVEPTGQLPVTIPDADFDDVLYPFGHGLGY